jgi:transposase
MSKHFRPWKIDQAQLLPPSVQDFVPKDHLSRLVVALVTESLELSAISASYTSGLGQPPFDPRMMTALLLNGYASGIYSSRRIAKACIERADFMMIVAGDPPDFRTISDFRKRHLEALAGLFVQVLKLAEKAGLVKLGHVALDGTKIEANASKHKAMSYARMKQREGELQAEVDRWLATAQAADAEEDRLHGDKRGDELPKWVSDKQKRIEKIRAAKAELEAEAKAAAEEERRIKAEAERQRIAEGRKKRPGGKPDKPISEEPDAKAQRNFTDPESRIMTTRNGVLQGYNAQAAVDGRAQIILAHGLIQTTSDHGQVVPLVDDIAANLGRAPIQVSADCGYLSEANLAALPPTSPRGVPIAQPKGAANAARSPWRCAPSSSGLDGEAGIG